jgi:hypothetical protein
LCIKYYLKHYGKTEYDIDEQKTKTELYNKPDMITELPNFAEELQESVFDDDDDNNELKKLNEAVKNAREEGDMSEYMINDFYNQQYNKILFNETARRHVG